MEIRESRARRAYHDGRTRHPVTVSMILPHPPRRGGLLLVLTLLTGMPWMAGADTPAPRKVEITRDDVTLTLAPQRSDPVLAFYLGRGFPAELARRIVDHCLVSVGISNGGGSTIRYALDRWRYLAPDGEWRAPRPKEDWIRERKEHGVVFGFSMLSGAQTFQPGDWNSALLAFDVPAGGRFDLRYQWFTGGHETRGTVTGIRCATDGDVPG